MLYASIQWMSRILIYCFEAKGSKWLFCCSTRFQHAFGDFSFFFRKKIHWITNASLCTNTCTNTHKIYMFTETWSVPMFSIHISDSRKAFDSTTVILILWNSCTYSFRAIFYLFFLHLIFHFSHFCVVVLFFLFPFANAISPWQRTPPAIHFIWSALWMCEM